VKEMKRLTKQEKFILQEAAKIQKSLQTKQPRILNEYTGGDDWQKVNVSDDSWQHLEVGISYKVKGMPGTHLFKNWVDENGQPTSSEIAEDVYLLFEDESDGELWEAYEFDGKFAWGSSATTLIIKDSLLDSSSW